MSDDVDHRLTSCGGQSETIKNRILSSRGAKRRGDLDFQIIIKDCFDKKRLAMTLLFMKEFLIDKRNQSVGSLHII